MNSTVNLETFTVPLSFAAHELAETCAAGLSNTVKTQQIYQNTLAVYAVDYYLRLMGFTPAWPHSQSRDPLMVQIQDVADLNVNGIGTLECRIISPGAEHCTLPDEAQTGRVGYILVELSPSLKAATILGFTPTAAPQLARTQLVNVEQMLVHLSHLEVASPIQVLSAWLQESERLAIDGWQQLKTLFGTQPDLAWQTLDASETVQTERGKRFVIGASSQPLVLVLELQTEAADTFAIRVKVRTEQELQFLPLGLELALVDETGATLEAIQAQDQDNWMQLPRFRGTGGESFQIQLRLDKTVITETFEL